LKDPDAAIAWVLRIGGSLSAAIIVIGMTVVLLGGNGRAIITAGLLVLIATPVVRVAFSIFIFVRARDKTYAAITTAVLLILLFGFLVGAVSA